MRPLSVGRFFKNHPGDRRVVHDPETNGLSNVGHIVQTRFVSCFLMVGCVKVPGCFLSLAD